VTNKRHRECKNQTPTVGHRQALEELHPTVAPINFGNSGGRLGGDTSRGEVGIKHGIVAKGNLGVWREKSGLRFPATWCAAFSADIIREWAASFAAGIGKSCPKDILGRGQAAHTPSSTGGVLIANL